jgi:hypothetical protein
MNHFVHASCSHDEGKCCTYGNDYWGAEHEPVECADGYLHVVDWQDDRFICLPGHCDVNHFVRACELLS